MDSIRDHLPKSIQMAFTSNVCELHNRKNPVYTMLIEGEEVCPLCESDRRSEELSKQETEKIAKAHLVKSYNVLQSKSLIRDKSIADASFGNYAVQEEEETTNKQRAADAFQKYKKGQVFNTWLTGLPGVGKSHLAMSLLRNLNEMGSRDKSCLFIDIDEMLRLIRDSFNNRESQYTERYFIDLLSNVDYLVLDDLGAETGDIDSSKKASEFTSKILRAVCNARQDKSTIITTNLTRGALEKMYDPKLVSRLMKNTFLINFKETSDKRIRNIDF